MSNKLFEMRKKWNENSLKLGKSEMVYYIKSKLLKKIKNYFINIYFNKKKNNKLKKLKYLYVNKYKKDIIKK